MAKKKSTDDAPVPNPNSVQNRDIMQRLNFLYQASVFLGTPPLPPAAGPSTPPDESPSAPATVEQNEPELSRRQMRRREVRLARHPSTALDLSRACVKSMRVIGQKTTVRMDPAVKRRLCKKCSIVLVPGSTARVRIHSSRPHGHIISYVCTQCGTARRIPAPAEPDHDPGPDTETTASLDIPPAEAGSSDMVVDNPPKAKDQRKRSKKKTPVARTPPLFARRDAGHIVFRGNVRLDG